MGEAWAARLSAQASGQNTQRIIMTSLPVFPCGAGALMWEKQEIGVRWVLHVGGT